MDIDEKIREMAKQKNEMPADLKRRLFGQQEKPVGQQVEEASQAAYKEGYERGVERVLEKLKEEGILYGS